MFHGLWDGCLKAGTSVLAMPFALMSLEHDAGEAGLLSRNLGGMRSALFVGIFRKLGRKNVVFCSGPLAYYHVCASYPLVSVDVLRVVTGFASRRMAMGRAVSESFREPRACELIVAGDGFVLRRACVQWSCPTYGWNLFLSALTPWWCIWIASYAKESPGLVNSREPGKMRPCASAPALGKNRMSVLFDRKTVKAPFSWVIYPLDRLLGPVFLAPAFEQ